MVCSAECSVGGGRGVSPFMISGLRGVLQTAGEGYSRWLQLFYFSYLRLHVWQSLLSLITTLSLPVMKVIVKQAQPASSFLIFTIEEFHSKYRHFRQRPPIADIIYFSRIRSIIASISWYICHYKLSVSGGLTLTEEKFKYWPYRVTDSLNVQLQPQRPGCLSQPPCPRVTELSSHVSFLKLVTAN